jgi:hypothetical protein
MKKLHTLELNSGPLYMWQVFCHWTIKADTFTGLADLFLKLGSSDQQLCGNCMFLALKWSIVKIHTTVAGVLGSKLIFFHADILARHGSNLVFIVPFGISYVEFGSEVFLLEHVIQISIRQVHFQYIYSQL